MATAPVLFKRAAERGFGTRLPLCARIRVMISIAYSREDLDRGSEAFVKVGKELGNLTTLLRRMNWSRQ
jgi:hypothetical protein